MEGRLPVKVKIDLDHASITGAEGIISEEVFTPGEFSALADLLVSLNAPNNQGTPIRRLTDLLWALQNDTDAFILHSTARLEERET